MTTVSEAVNDFLAQRRIAVAGVSRNAAAHSGNAVYQRLRDRGYEVFAVNHRLGRSSQCRGRHRDAPAGGRQSSLTASGWASAASDASPFSGGSVSTEAVEAGRKAGMTVIEGGCPLMFGPTADFGHKCMRWMIGFTKAAPKAG
jgi:hypothetical protein